MGIWNYLGNICICSGIFLSYNKMDSAQAVQKSLTDKGITDVELDTIISRIVCYAVVWVIVTLIYAVRHSVTIKGDNYTIQVKYGNLLKETNCKKVINFDECYTTHIGPNPSDIKLHQFVASIFKVWEEVSIFKILLIMQR